LSPLENIAFDLHGVVGQRLAANTANWLLTAPAANPAMLHILRDRDRMPRRDLVPWAGEFAGKYLTSAALALRLSRDPQLEAHLRQFVADLIATQADDGYFGPFPHSARLFEPGLWDEWGHYHILLGLLLWHRVAGDEAALAACLRTADFLCGIFLDGGRRVVEAGSEEMNQALIHIFCLLFEHTGDERYLHLAREIERDFETPPSGDYVREALAGKDFYQFPKPRWESLHAIQGVAELYFITGDERYRRAFEHTWHSIARYDRHNTGGFSSGEQATGNPYDPRAIETCCTVAWMALTVDMLRMTGDATVADELELSLFNAVLGAQHPSGRWWTYNTPMDGERKASAHEIVFQARAGSPELNCCSVNGPRGLTMLADWAVMACDGGLVVNFYGPSTVSARLPAGPRVTIAQHTDYPLSDQVRIVVAPEAPARFALWLRIPGWSKQTEVAINGQRHDAPTPGSYLALDRTWAAGDTIELSLDFSLRAWIGERDCTGKLSLYCGPILLTYDPRFDAYACDEVPQLDVARLDAELVERPDASAPAPLLLTQLTAADGRMVTLCDFTSAGATGTPYISWLPMTISSKLA
jgi:DUF1680 family protein